MPNVVISTYIPLKMYEKIEQLVQNQKYKNRSDMVRKSIENELKRHQEE